jgi:hypothetical protein
MIFIRLPAERAAVKGDKGLPLMNFVVSLSLDEVHSIVSAISGKHVPSL